MLRFSGSRCGASPVMATVLISGIIIVAALAIAFWMGGIATEFTRFEKIEIMSWNAEKDSILGQFNVTFEVKNTGPATATMLDAFVNGKPLSHYAASHNIPSGGLTVETDEIVMIDIYIPTSMMESGSNPEVKLLSAAGKDYPALIRLP